MPGHRIGVIFGTRPEAIKLAPVILALRRDPRFSCRVWVTAQHRDLLDQVLKIFALQPDRDLDVMRPDQQLAELTGQLLRRLDAAFAAEPCDLVLVQGDTTSSFCAALAAFYRHIPVAHVEAGLRTGDLQAPWPEEANRVLISRLAALHFAPTETARRNLLAEGIPADRIHVTGNTVIDALRLILERTQKAGPAAGQDNGTRELAGIPDPIVLVTAHRRETFGLGLASICTALRMLAERFTETHFVYPVHPNPQVQAAVPDLLGDPPPNNLHLLSPLPYSTFVQALHRCRLILTDSGGIQEEAPSFAKPVLVLRAVTERPEVIEAGCARLVGTDPEVICREATRLLTDPLAYRAMAQAPNPYGDGQAAARILDHCACLLAAAKGP